MAMAQIYSYATSQIQYNYQNFLLTIFKNILHKYNNKENTHIITKKNTYEKLNL